MSLTWGDPDHPVSVELQQGRSTSFTEPVTRYRGPDQGSVLTGLLEGTHYFRIRSHSPEESPGQWSEPYELVVDYMDRGPLFAFLATGGLVVALTIGAIVGGHRRTRQEG